MGLVNKSNGNVGIRARKKAGMSKDAVSEDGKRLCRCDMSRQTVIPHSIAPELLEDGIKRFDCRKADRWHHV